MNGKVEEGESLLKNEDASHWDGTNTDKTQHAISKDDAEESYKIRWRSIRIMYMLLAQSSIQFAMVRSSLWPYLQEVDSTVTVSFLGWTSAGFSTSQIIGAIVFGAWCYYRPAIQPIVFSILCEITGSLLYLYGLALPIDGIFLILAARILLGFSTGVAAVSRTVISQSTTLKERVEAFADMAVWQTIGFFVGPAMQLAAVPIGNRGIHIASMGFTLDLYTAPGLVGIILGAAKLVLVLMCFKEVKVDIYEGEKGIKLETNHTKKPDAIAIFVLVVLFFSMFYTLGVGETMMSPLAMDELAWTHKEAVLYVSIFLTVGGIICVPCFYLTKHLCTKYGERKVIVAGILTLLLGYTIYLPWGNSYPKLQTEQLIKGTNKVKLTPGCRMKYTWCKTTPKIYFPQFVVAASLATLGFPVMFLAIDVMYSKALGPTKQAKYMSLITAANALARMAGPLLSTMIYSHSGPRWTYFTTDVIIFSCILLFLFFYNRIVPFHEYAKLKKAVE